METSKELQQDFAWALFQRYRRYCDKQDEDGGFQHFTAYMIQCGIIKERTIQRFMISELYPQALACCGGKKLEAITLLSIRIGLSEKTIESLIHNPQRLKLK